MAQRIPCTACQDIWGPSKAQCPECRGVGFFEISTCTAGKKWKTECPVYTDVMTGGFQCDKCGDSGPW